MAFVFNFVCKRWKSIYSVWTFSLMVKMSVSMLESLGSCAGSGCQFQPPVNVDRQRQQVVAQVVVSPPPTWDTALGFLPLTLAWPLTGTADI